MTKSQPKRYSFNLFHYLLLLFYCILHRWTKMNRFEFDQNVMRWKKKHAHTQNKIECKCKQECRVLQSIPQPLMETSAIRNYSAKQPLTLQLIKERVLLVLNLYDKVDPSKVLYVFIIDLTASLCGCAIDCSKRFRKITAFETNWTNFLYLIFSSQKTRILSTIWDWIH